MPKFFVTHGEAEAAESLAEALKTRGFEALVPELEQEVALVPREAGQKLSEAIADAKAAPLPEKIAETETPADPGGAAVAEEKNAPAAKSEAAAPRPAAEKPLTKEQKKTAEKKARRANRRAVKVLEDIGDQMREIYEKAGSGEIAAESQPLLDAVAVLLDSIIAQSGGNVTKN